MKHSLIRYMTVASAVLLTSGAALAHGPGHAGQGPCSPCPGCGAGMGQGAGMGAGPGWRSQGLGLNADQQKQVTALEAKFDAEVAPLRAQMAAKRAELQALWSAAAPDRKAIVAKQAELDPLREKIRTAQVDFQLGVHKLLTPEQRELWTAGRGCEGSCGPGVAGDAPCGNGCPHSW